MGRERLRGPARHSHAPLQRVEEREQLIAGAVPAWRPAIQWLEFGQRRLLQAEVGV
jgi:hypothetical protein